MIFLGRQYFVRLQHIQKHLTRVDWIILVHSRDALFMLGGFKSNGTILPKRMEDTIPSKRLSKHKTQLMIEAKLCLPSRLLPWIVSLLMIGNFFGCILLLLHTFKIVRENKLMWWVEFSKQYFSEVHRRECDVLCDRNCLRDAYIWVQLVSGSVWLGVKTLAGSNYVLGGYHEPGGLAPAHWKGRAANTESM
jgi:hypothetical protein